MAGFGKGGVYKIAYNSAGAVATLNDPGVAADIQRRAEAIHAGLPDDDGAEWFIGHGRSKDRPYSIVGTQNAAAKRLAAEDNALQRAIDRGR